MWTVNRSRLASSFRLIRWANLVPASDRASRDGSNAPCPYLKARSSCTEVSLEPGNHIPAFTRAVKKEAWREACYKGLGVVSDKPDARRQAFNRAVADLLKKTTVETWDEWYWPT